MNNHTLTTSPSRASQNSDGAPHHIADEPVSGVDTGEATVQSPTTETGLPVEDQIDKEWDPNKDGGLPTFLNIPRA